MQHFRKNFWWCLTRKTNSFFEITACQAIERKNKFTYFQTFSENPIFILNDTALIQERTYSFHYYDDRFFELCKEAGEVYTQSINEFWRMYKEEGTWLSKFDLQKHMKDKIERNNLHSDSFLAAMQQVHANLASWKDAKKIKPETKPPYKEKFLQPVTFKQSQIKFIDSKLRITIDKHKSYIYLAWNKDIPVPVYGRVGYDKVKGWHIDLVVKQDIEQAKSLDPNKGMAIDLGVKRIAALFDGERTITMNGKTLKAIVRYRNKTDAEYKEKLAKKEKDSNAYKKLKRARRKAVAKIQNIKKDTLNKQSRFIVDYAENKNIGKIVIGDNSGTHDKLKMRHEQKQMVQQFPEQQLKKYVIEKFESIYGEAEVKPEPYTSQTCPICGKRHKTSTRVYKCKDCGFIYDRDGVGAINIYCENVSLVEDRRIRRLARPFGIKFKDDLSFKQYAKQLDDLPISPR